MIMKFNWGTGILLTIILFILAVVGFYIYSSNLDINLVEENYYEKELAYQQKIDRIKNTGQLPEPVIVKLEKKQLILDFPQIFNGKEIDGNILFYRPSDPNKDFTVALQLNDSVSQAIDASRLDPGRYVIKIDWIVDGKAYYYEEEIFNE